MEGKVSLFNFYISSVLIRGQADEALCIKLGFGGWGGGRERLRVFFLSGSFFLSISSGRRGFGVVFFSGFFFHYIFVAPFLSPTWN